MYSIASNIDGGKPFSAKGAKIDGLLVPLETDKEATDPRRSGRKRLYPTPLFLRTRDRYDE